MTIQTNMQSLNLDDFYALVCSEEINMVPDSQKEVSAQPSTDQQFSLTSRNHGRR